MSEGNQEFCKADFVEDFEFLWDSFSNEYAYLEDVPIDWQKVRGHYFRQVETVATLDSFMTVVERVLEELCDDHVHLTANTSTSPRIVPARSDLHARWEAGRAVIKDQAGRSSHPSAVLSDGEFGVFAKLGVGPCAAELFRCEAAGLAAISEMAGVLTPAVVDCLPIAHGALLVLKAVDVIERTEAGWEEAGWSLARTHSVKGRRFGFDEDSYWGDFRQDNRPLDSWTTFFWERWIEPKIAYGLYKGHLTVDLAQEIGRLRDRLDRICGSPVEPSLVHGDAHQNNILSTLEGPVFIDPNVHFGHPELDLAFVDYFQPVPEALFSAYTDVLPIDEGFSERREFWRLPFYLAMVEGQGGLPYDRLRAVLDQFL